MLVRHSSYFCKSEKSCSAHCCCCWVLLSCCGLYLSLLCSFPCISNICNFYVPVDSWYHAVNYILTKCYKINIKIVLNLSLLKGMIQFIRFLSHFVCIHKFNRSGGLLIRPLLVVVSDDGCSAGGLAGRCSTSASSSKSLSICVDGWICSSRGALRMWRLFLRRISPLSISTKYDLFGSFFLTTPLWDHLLVCMSWSLTWSPMFSSVRSRACLS